MEGVGCEINMFSVSKVFTPLRVDFCTFSNVRELLLPRPHTVYTLQKELESDKNYFQVAA